MRVLFQLDQSAYEIPGGHRRQLDKTLQALREEGVEAEYSPDDAARLDDFDIVHLFCLGREFFENARRQRVPIALSPIYWSRSYALNTHRMAGPWHYLKVETKTR